jgi:hypothetical protein
MKEMATIFVVAVVMGVGLCSADAAIFDLTGPDGLSASAVFTLNNPTELQITLINNSTGVPAGSDSSDQLLTGISWDFGMAAVGATGTVVIGSGGRSINFDNVITQLGAGDDVSGEWGYGNTGGTGMLTNIVSTNAANVTRFSGANLDGPLSLDGPQGGICTDPPQVSLGGLGVVADSVVITLTLDTSLANLNFLENGVVAEFGSDAAFLPEPATICLLGFGALSLIRRKHRVCKFVPMD